MAIEFSRWMFPAMILSGWLSPLVFLLTILGEVIGLW